MTDRELDPGEADAILSELGLDKPPISVSHAKPLSGEFEKVDPDAIIIPEERIRKEYDEKEFRSLLESIRRRGLIHPPVVTRELVLSAGEHRTLCCRILKKQGDPRFQQIPVQYTDQCTPAELRAIELEENIKRVDITWQEEKLAFAELVELNKQERGLTQAQTAEEIGYDPSTVSNNLKIARELKEGNSEVMAAGSAREAERIYLAADPDRGRSYRR